MMLHRVIRQVLLSGSSRPGQVGISTSCAPSLDKIRDHLKQFAGGSVDLDLDSGSGLAVLTLNHVDKMNAMSGNMMVELADRVTELELWSDGKGVILKGAGTTFCSGGDLSFVKATAEPEQGNNMCYFMQHTMNRFSSLPLITFALIQGRALGGGAELTTACDFRLMTTSAKLGFVQCRMGVTTGWGGGTKLVKILGSSKALSLLCSGTVLDACGAKDLGLVDHVLPEMDSVLDDAKTLVSGQYCRAEARVVRAVKRVVIAASDNSLHAAHEQEREIFRTTWGGPQHLAAMNKNIKHN